VWDDDLYDEAVAWTINQVIEALEEKKWDKISNDIMLAMYQDMEGRDPFDAFEEYLRECQTP